MKVVRCESYLMTMGPLFRTRWSLLLTGLLSCLSVMPALAQGANFKGLTLAANFLPSEARVSGNTAGYFSLSNIVPRDSKGNLCLGFADSTPDHILVLQQDFSSLTLQVDSGGNDTTLLVQGPTENAIRCGSITSRRNPDAQIQDSYWPAGAYRIWVGAFNQGERLDYVLTVNE